MAAPVLAAKEGPVGVLTASNCPEALNALNHPLMDALEEGPRPLSRRTSRSA